MRILSTRSIPATATSVSGIIGILIALFRIILRLIGFLPSSDDLVL